MKGKGYYMLRNLALFSFRLSLFPKNVLEKLVQTVKLIKGQ